ncbi:MAG: methylated-DNA--[protein]-cysteine S-methyltransferase [Desulfuromonadales bacterium]|nr:methylated-DNA--[protein]-cysteine S-methyltransferase [Desulfuromonadales bacterium]
MPNDYQRMTEIILFLKRHAGQQPSLEAVATKFNLSPGYLQRLFRRYTGISPKRYLQYLTSEKAKQLLDQSMPLLETSFAAGLSGSGRLHDLLVNVDAVTPGEYRSKGEHLLIRYGIHATPFGQALIALTARGICHLDFFDDDGATAFKQLRKNWSNAEFMEDLDATMAVKQAAFSPRSLLSSKPLLLHLQGSNFQLKVWQALLQIPPGCLASYRQIAQHIGQPSASRAVGSAIGQNPICYIIPCHRVLRSDGTIGGYRSGTARKEVLLSAEIFKQRDPSAL